MVGTAAPGTERLRVNMVISENTSQTVVRGRISVPDPKPDVDKVLSTEKTVVVKNVNVLPDKVVVEGTLNIQIVYVAFKPTQSVHSFHGQLTFTTFVDVEGALPGMTVDADVVVEDVNITRSPDCARDFDVAAVLEVSAKVSEIQDIDVVTQCPEGCTCDTEQISVDHVVGSNSRQVIISNQFDVPIEKPPVEKILDVDAKVEVKQTRVLRNKVIFDGEATVEVLYVGMLPDQPVHQLHRTFKFSDFVDVPGARQDMQVRFDVMVESVDVEPVRHKADRLEANLVLKLTANVVEPRNVNVITDVRDCDINPVFTNLWVDSLIGEGTSQVVEKDTFETPEPKPDVEKILDTTVEAVRVTDTRILNDKVIVKGFQDIQITYVALKADQAVHSMHRRIDFNTFVEVMGAQADMGMDVEVDPVVEFITASARGCEITIEKVLKVNVRVTETIQREVLTSVSAPTTAPPTTAAPTTTPCPPGGTFEHMVKQGETLYSIGRLYGVSVNQMIAANPQLPNPNNIRPGIIINVPCVPKG